MELLVEFDIFESPIDELDRLDMLLTFVLVVGSTKSEVMADSTNGEVVSIVMLIGVEAGEVLPAPSLALAVIVCAPSDRGVDGVNDHALCIIEELPNRLSPSNTKTVEEASAVPEIGGLLLSTTSPLTGLVIAGGGGGIVSIVTVTGCDAGDVPDESCALAVIV
jgi:hypothetical protein